MGGGREREGGKIKWDICYRIYGGGGRGEREREWENKVGYMLADICVRVDADAYLSRLHAGGVA